ncbi:hypothetical protein [Clostridium sp. B9]|uniref:hypothetical protein n=1 Tax=Clostridium sp. B9 TaxID=3423224 RepID=UPI003D2F3995
MFTKGFDEAYGRALELKDMFSFEKEKYNEELKVENRDIKHLVNKINEEKIYILETLIPKYARNMSILNRKAIKATLGEEVSSEYMINNYDMRPIKELLLVDDDEKTLMYNLKAPFIKVFKVNSINKNLDEEMMEIQASIDEMKKVVENAKEDKQKLIGIYKLLCLATNLGEAIEQRFRDFIPMIESSRLIYGDTDIEKRSYRIANVLKCYEGVTLLLVKVCETRYRKCKVNNAVYVNEVLINEHLEELNMWKEYFYEI